MPTDSTFSQLILETEMLGVEFFGGPTDYIPEEKINAKVKCLYQPSVSYKDMTSGTRFNIVEGDQAVGSGLVIDSNQTSIARILPLPPDSE